MIELEIDFDSPDIENFKELKPTNGEKLYFLLDLTISPKNEKTLSFYQLIIANAVGLADFELKDTNLQFINHTLLVKTYNWPEIEKKIRKIVKKCETKTFEKSAKLLAEYFLWEYNDEILFDKHSGG